MDFEWDETKARANEKKHGVSFLEAAEVFGDDYSSCVHDPDHSSDEVDTCSLVFPQKEISSWCRIPKGQAQFVLFQRGV